MESTTVPAPIIGVCSLGQRWFWIVLPGAKSDAINIEIVPLGTGYELEKWRAEQAAYALVFTRTGDSRCFAMTAGEAKAFHRHLTPKVRVQKTPAQRPGVSAISKLGIVESDGTISPWEPNRR